MDRNEVKQIMADAFRLLDKALRRALPIVGGAVGSVADELDPRPQFKPGDWVTTGGGQGVSRVSTAEAFRAAHGLVVGFDCVYIERADGAMQWTYAERASPWPCRGGQVWVKATDRAATVTSVNPSGMIEVAAAGGFGFSLLRPDEILPCDWHYEAPRHCSECGQLIPAKTEGE